MNKNTMTEEELRALLSAALASKSDRRSVCLSSEAITGFVLKELIDSERAQVVSHLVGCGSCFSEVLSLTEAERDELAPSAPPRFEIPAQQPVRSAEVVPLFSKRVRIAVSFFAGAIAATLAIGLFAPSSYLLKSTRGLSGKGEAKRPGEQCKENRDCTSGICESSWAGGQKILICRKTEGDRCDRNLHPLGNCASGLVCAPRQDRTVCVPGECQDDRSCPAARPRCVNYTCQQENG